MACDLSKFEAAEERRKQVKAGGEEEEEGIEGFKPR